MYGLHLHLLNLIHGIIPGFPDPGQGPAILFTPRTGTFP